MPESPRRTSEASPGAEGGHDLLGEALDLLASGQRGTMNCSAM
jgi:hypothetical protein